MSDLRAAIYAQPEEFIQVYVDDEDPEFVNQLIMLINRRREQWLQKEFRWLMDKLRPHNLQNDCLEVYVRLLRDVDAAQALGKPLEFTSLNAIYEYFYKKHLKLSEEDFQKPLDGLSDEEIALEINKPLPFKWLKSKDRKKFFGRGNYFDQLLAAGLMVKEKVSNSKKHNYRDIYRFPIPKYVLGLRYILRGEEEGSFSGREDHWDVGEFTEALEMYLWQDGDVGFRLFRDAFTGKIPDDNIDLISYLEQLNQKLWEPKLPFLFEVSLKYMKRIKPELFE